MTLTRTSIILVDKELRVYADRPGPYVARSASDKTEDWPFWFVHGADGMNCARFADNPLAIFMPRELAMQVAEALNRAEGRS
jgi:hypothetical protein